MGFADYLKDVGDQVVRAEIKDHYTDKNKVAVVSPDVISEAGQPSAAVAPKKYATGNEGNIEIMGVKLNTVALAIGGGSLLLAVVLIVVKK